MSVKVDSLATRYTQTLGHLWSQIPTSLAVSSCFVPLEQCVSHSADESQESGLMDKKNSKGKKERKDLMRNVTKGGATENRLSL